MKWEVKKTGPRLANKSEAEMLQVKAGDPTCPESHLTALLKPLLASDVYCRCLPS